MFCDWSQYQKFAPQCYHCRTPIIDERFITLDDPALGKRTYHEQHFFCAECGDPFLAPTIPGRGRGTNSEAGVVSQEDDVGFTVYQGHPYCEACHVRLRYPKCKRCKMSIRDGMQAVEALGGKWCWGCFLCAVSNLNRWFMVSPPSLSHECRAARDPLTILHFSSETRSLIASHALVLLSGMRSNLHLHMAVVLLCTTHFHFHDLLG